MGKGSNPRPYSVSKQQFNNNFDAIFRNKHNEIGNTLTRSDTGMQTNDSGSGKPTSTDSTESRRATENDNKSSTAN